MPNISNYWRQAKPQNMDISGIMSGISRVNYGQANQGIDLLNRSYEDLRGLAEEDLSGLGRQNIREDIGSLLAGQQSQTRQMFGGGGISAGLANAANRTNSQQAYSSVGRAERDLLLGQQQQRAGIYGQMGGMASNIGQLGLGISGVQAGVRGQDVGARLGVAQSNFGAQNQWQLARAGAYTQQEMDRRTNRANERAGRFSGLLQAGVGLGLMFVPGGQLAGAGLMAGGAGSAFGGGGNQSSNYSPQGFQGYGGFGMNNQFSLGGPNG